MHLHFLYAAVFIQRCGIIYVLGGSLTLRYRGKGDLLIKGGLRGETPPCLSACAYRYGDERRAPARQGWAGAAAAGVKVMEMHEGRRPVYGGAPRTGV